MICLHALRFLNADISLAIRRKLQLQREINVMFKSRYVSPSIREVAFFGWRHTKQTGHSNSLQESTGVIYVNERHEMTASGPFPLSFLFPLDVCRRSRVWSSEISTNWSCNHKTNVTYCLIRVWNLITQIAGRTQAEGACDQRAHENIDWPYVLMRTFTGPACSWEHSMALRASEKVTGEWGHFHNVALHSLIYTLQQRACYWTKK